MADQHEIERRLARLETSVARCVDALFYLISDSSQAPKIVAKLCVMRDEIRREANAKAERATAHPLIEECGRTL
jgi:hypothetical protein